MEKAIDNAKDLARSINAYLKSRVQLLQLLAAEKLSLLFSNLLGSLIVGIALLFCIFFISFGLSLFIGLWIGKLWIGFLAVGLLHLLIGIIFWALRSKMIRFPVMNAMIKQFISLRKNNIDNLPQLIVEKRMIYMEQEKLAAEFFAKWKAFEESLNPIEIVREQLHTIASDIKEAGAKSFSKKDIKFSFITLAEKVAAIFLRMTGRH